SLMQPASGLSTSLGDASATLGTKRSSATYPNRARQYASILPPLEVVKSISHLAEGRDKAHHISVEAWGFLHEKWRHVFGSRVPCISWLRGRFDQTESWRCRAAMRGGQSPVRGELALRANRVGRDQ